MSYVFTVSSVLFLVLQVVFSLSDYKANYSIIGQKLLKPGTPYSFTVSIHDGNAVDYVLNARIKDVFGGIVIVDKSFTINSGTTSLLTLEVPEILPNRKYELHVNASGEVEFIRSHTLNFGGKVYSVFIQTDKVLYKPGQKVLFRVIAITPDLKPYKGKINVTIYDSAENRIKKLVDLQNENGVVSDSLQLSDITPLGKWKIVSETHFAKVEKVIEVAEYVLPKFEVQVVLPSFYFVNKKNPSLQEDLHVSVIAKYTHGKPVLGTATVTVNFDHQNWYWNTNKINKNIQLVEGKGDFSITLTDLLNICDGRPLARYLRYPLVVHAAVIETATGVTLSGRKTTPFQTERFKLEFLPNSPDNYKIGLPYYGYLRLKSIDGTPVLLSDIKNGGSFKNISLKFQTQFTHLYEQFQAAALSTHYETLNENGYVVFTLTPLKNSERVTIEASFYDEIANDIIRVTKTITKFHTREEGGIQISLKNTENIIKPNTNLEFCVKTTSNITEFQFYVLGKGLIVESKQIKSNLPQTEHCFSFHVSPELAIKLAPEAMFVVSFVTSSAEIIADSLALSVVDYFANKVTLSFNKNSTEPGDEDVYLNIKSKENSFVGLLAVDQSVLLLSSGNDVTEDIVKEDLKKYSEVPKRYDPFDFPFYRAKRSMSGIWPRWLGGADTYSVIDRSGAFILTNLYLQKRPLYPMNSIYYSVMDSTPRQRMTFATSTRPTGRAEISEASTTTIVRTNFPETWIWNEITSNSSGDYQLKVKVPDTITSWVATGFSVNQDAGLGLSESPVKISVLKPFFVSLNLPYSIIRGEEFALQVTVFNYFGQNLEVDVKLASSTYFKVIKCDNKELESVDVIKKTEIANNDAKSVYFWVVATSLGQIPIEVSAHAGLAADAMKATLLVKPEGQTQSYSTSNFIQLTSGDTYESVFNVTLPPNGTLVPGSVVIEVTVIGDVIGPAMNNIDDLLKMPYGCGEQNLVNLVPDVYLLKYLTETGQLTEEFDQKAKGFINAGYQKELTFQRDDGSYSAFGNNDKAGSVWLSSFVIKCFHQAKNYVPVEDQKIAKTLEWIVGLQSFNGTFAEPPLAKILDTKMQGGSASGIALTAYVLISMLETKNIATNHPWKFLRSINKAKLFLENNFNSYSDDPYVLAIVSYALFKAESSKLQETLNLLDKLAVNENGLTYWKKETIESSTNYWRGPYTQMESYSIEIASYVLLIYAQKKDLSKSLPIGKWLLKQRNAFGGFSSTQDTVLALEALASFAPLIISPSDGAGITLSVTGDSNSSTHAFDTVTRQNALFLQSVQLPESTKSIDVKATGAGVAIVQLNVKYNIDDENKDQFLTLNMATNTSNDNLDLKIETSWSGTEMTGMVVIEINILTGYSLLDDANFIQQIGDNFKKIEKNSNKIVIYLDQLTKDPLIFNVHLQKTLKVTKVKPALVKAYRYYQPGSPVNGFYSPTSVETWEGACSECCS